MEEQVPDATTLLKFRHLLEKHSICEALFKDIVERLDAAGLMMRGGTIVDPCRTICRVYGGVVCPFSGK